jgi:hypothetical protein
MSMRQHCNACFHAHGPYHTFAMNLSGFTQALLHARAWACLLHIQRKLTTSTERLLVLPLRCPMYCHAAACRTAAAAAQAIYHDGTDDQLHRVSS